MKTHQLIIGFTCVYMVGYGLYQCEHQARNDRCARARDYVASYQQCQADPHCITSLHEKRAYQRQQREEVEMCERRGL